MNKDFKFIEFVSSTLYKTRTDLPMHLRKICSAPSYGEIGFFSKNDFYSRKYQAANWGSRKWEYYYAEYLLNKLGVKNKKIIDIGLGLLSQYSFYKFYLKSGCFLTAYDPDPRLKSITALSNRCKLVCQSAEKLDHKDNSIDIVVAISALEHFPIAAFKKTVKETARVLKSNGHFVVTLDITYDHLKSAPWAILEKTINKLPAGENNLKLKKASTFLTPQHFIKLLSPYFYAKNYDIKNSDLPVDKLVYSPKWNSYIAYFHFYKKN
ncbi:class I SAM-dependent methyltransferase [Candidatus Beckwithbacteria bacterium]|nr:class I SAM-dependent methyltransferase [Candidatus Beckwithbacteria bacterium]